MFNTKNDTYENFQRYNNSNRNKRINIKSKDLYIEFLCTKIDINTISGMARKENKAPRGIKISNRYRKINIGDALLCIKGLKDNKIPF